MNSNDGQKEVYFHIYCRQCKFWELRENQDPCFECLDNPVNTYSHKPKNYEENEKIKKGAQH